MHLLDVLRRPFRGWTAAPPRGGTSAMTPEAIPVSGAHLRGRVELRGRDLFLRQIEGDHAGAPLRIDSSKKMN